jgi:Fic family protein
MDMLRQAIAAKRKRLDSLRPLSAEALAKLEHYYDLEITYTSNAIEGNTLSPVETTLVVEQGITIAGKPLRDHMEALDHYDAIRYVRELARHAGEPLAEVDVRNVHSLVVKRSRPEIAGRYADLARFVRTETGRHMFPAPVEVPSLMTDFAAWLRSAPDTPEASFVAHRRLVDIHPFNDGNGRVARLLMNLMLIRGGYPPIAVRPEDRPVYIRVLQQAQSGGGTESFDALLYERLDATLADYVGIIESGLSPGPSPSPAPRRGSCD